MSLSLLLTGATIVNVFKLFTTFYTASLVICLDDLRCKQWIRAGDTMILKGKKGREGREKLVDSKCKSYTE